jgi:hypothetical protein
VVRVTSAGEAAKAGRLPAAWQQQQQQEQQSGNVDERSSRVFGEHSLQVAMIANVCQTL